MFTEYINRFLALVERGVKAYEDRTAMLAKTTSHTVIDAQGGVETTMAQDVKTAEQNVQQAETGTRRQRTRAGVQGNDAGEATSPPADTKTQEQPAEATSGRRQRVRATEATEQQLAGTESTAGAGADSAGSDAGAGSAGNGRRQRTRATQQEEKKPEPVKDTPEQAEDREEVENLCRMAGEKDACRDEVLDYFKEKGWRNGSEVPADALIDTINDLNDILDKYFDDQE